MEKVKREVEVLADQYVDLRNELADANGDSPLDIYASEIVDIYNWSRELDNGKINPYSLIVTSLYVGIAKGINFASKSK